MTDPWKMYDPVAPSYVTDLTQFSTGLGFWIDVNTACDLVVSY
jgi:hypothetical protein